MPLIIRRKAASVPVERAPPEAPVMSPGAMLSLYDTGQRRKAGALLDDQCRAVSARSISAPVSWFLMISYLTHVHQLETVSAGLFEELAIRIREQWNENNHPHKTLLDPATLSPMSLEQLPGSSYPSMTKEAAKNLVKGSWGLIIDTAKDRP